MSIYKAYNGDGDGFVRSASIEEKASMSYEDWRLIDNFLQDIYLVQKGIASHEFSQELCRRLREKVENKTVIDRLIELANMR